MIETARGKVRPGLCTRMARVLMLSMPFMFQHMTMKKEYLSNMVRISVRLGWKGCVKVRREYGSK